MAHGAKAEPATEAITRQARQVLALVCFATFMGALDSSVVNVAYPSLTAALHASVAAVGWVGISFLLVRTTLLAIFGRLSDMVGHKRVYMAGFTVFLLGSVLSGLSTSVGVLIGFRCLQAAGAAMLTSNSAAILTSQFPRSRMASAFSLIEATVSVALGFGPVLGGLLIQFVGWRSIFYVNVPIAIAALIAAGRLLPPMPGGAARERFDFGGAAAFAAGMVGVLLGANLAPSLGWLSPPVLVLVGCGLGLIWLFLHLERRVAFPMIDLSLFSVRTFAAANAAKIFAYVTVYVVSFTVPFYLQDVLGYPPAKLGAALLPVPVAMGVGSLVGGPLAERFGSRLLAPGGLVMAAVGAFLFARLTPAAGYPPVAVAMVVQEFGIGLFVAPNDGLIMQSVPAARSGVASGILALTRNLGMILGITMAATVLEAFLGSHLAGGGAGPLPAAFAPAFLGGFHLAFAASVGICLAGALISLLR